MRRRSFLTGSLFAAAGLAAAVRAQEKPSLPPTSPGKPDEVPPVDTPPVLQIPAETSIGVAWGVTQLSTGWVEYATSADFTDLHTACAGGFGLKALDDHVLSVRLTGLRPSTRYYYRTVTQRISAPDAYKIKTDGAPIVCGTNTFTTLGAKSGSSFCVINDTHEQSAVFLKLAEKINELKPDVTVWNGDICNQLKSADHAKSILLRAAGPEAFAASTPILYTPGNHDYRGIWARELPEVMMTRQPEERDSRFASLPRNYAVRLGDIAMIGLDTGEDKPDRNPVWAGLANFEPYRKLQTEWLADALARPEIKSAPYILAFCHIPLFDPAPDANPGDILKAFASWQRPCGMMWSPFFKKYGVQAVITAHMHRFRCDEPTPDRPWRQIVGGGPNTQQGPKDTVMHGKVDNGKLTIKVYEVATGDELGSFAFAPRKFS